MSPRMHPHTLEVLHSLFLNPQSTTKEMQQRFPKVADMGKLLSNQSTIGNAIAVPAENKQFMWSITANGRNKIFPPKKGDMPTPRNGPPTEPYTGEPNSNHRAGSEDFLKCGSLQNGELVPRVRPAIISCRELQVVGVYGSKVA